MNRLHSDSLIPKEFSLFPLLALFVILQLDLIQDIKKEGVTRVTPKRVREHIKNRDTHELNL